MAQVSFFTMDSRQAQCWSSGEFDIKSPLPSIEICDIGRRGTRDRGISCHRHSHNGDPCVLSAQKSDGD